MIEEKKFNVIARFSGDSITFAIGTLFAFSEFVVIKPLNVKTKKKKYVYFLKQEFRIEISRNCY